MYDDAPYNRSVHKFSNIGQINGDEIFDVIYDRRRRDNNANLKHGNNTRYTATYITVSSSPPDKSEVCLAKRVHKPVMWAIHYVKSHDDYQGHNATGARW